MSTESTKVPKRVFIVPYRNRVQHKFFFSKYMSFILEDSDDYEIFFSHQCDARTFNRGATKNIGFMAVRDKYPNDYKNITFIFNDIDTIPFTKIFDYETTQGIVKHYYGYKYALGGIVVIKGVDFEKMNGYPCFWGWGMEDNCLQKRCAAFNIKIDRSTFYSIGSPQILQLFDGISRIISKKDPWRMEHDNGIDGIKSISKLKYTIDDKSANDNDNIFSVINSRIHFINIQTFNTYVKFEQDNYYNYDLREPQRKIVNPTQLKETRKTVVTTEDWSNIPYYPTKKERRENTAKTLVSQGKPIPESLLKQIEHDKIMEIKTDVFNSNLSDSNNDNDNVENVIISNPHLQQQQQQQQQQYLQQHLQQQQQYLQQHLQQQYLQQQQQQLQQRRPKSQAQSSARIRLGGVF
jgi:hypothetical protein